MSEPITNLPDAVAALGALPVPVGPEPLSPEREAEIREWVEAMGRKKDIRYYGSWQQHGELLGEIDRLRAERAAIGDEVARFGICGAALPATKALVKRADELVTENGQLRARVAELEAELAVANGVLDDAAQARRDGAACPCPSVDRTHQVGCPEDGVPVASLREPDGEFHSFLHHENRVPHDLPETGGNR